MRQFISVIAFSLLTIAFFAGYSNYGIPQIEPAPPPTEEKLDLGSLTMETFITAGENIFGGKGKCTLCHNELGRAPELKAIGELASKRLADPRYEGEADTIEDYLVESLLEPSVFVVAGFGKKGTDDSESPMPKATSGSVGLSDAEVIAVVAYLQDQGGIEVTVEIPTAIAEEVDEEAETELVEVAPEPREAISDPAQLIAMFTCDACHMIDGVGGEAGPDLSSIGASRDRDYLRTAIVDPNADIAEGFEPDMMPEGMGEQIYVSELEVLVDFLAGMK